MTTDAVAVHLSGKHLAMAREITSALLLSDVENIESGGGEDVVNSIVFIVRDLGRSCASSTMANSTRMPL